MTGLGIKELREKWNREKKHYRTAEVGTGVQVFVKDVLKSTEVLGLKVGLNCTKLEARDKEFLEEKTSKEGRRPDITIFITGEIVIPVEVEKFGSIEEGTAQLLKYQVDLDKKYGLLTDGYAWRFFNNNVYTELTLDSILGDVETFLGFWNEYIKAETYYLSFFEGHGHQGLLKETEQLPVEEHRQIFFEDISKLINSFKSKLGIEGYLKSIPEDLRSKRAVEITYAYIIQFVLYKTLVDNAFDEFPERYERLVDAIHRHLQKGRYKDILGCIGGMSAEISKNIYRPFVDEQRFIADTLLDLYHRPQNELHDVSPWLEIFVFIKKYNFAEIRNEIFGYVYENYLKAQYEDQKKGQYFTDPAVVNFMLEEIGFTQEEIKRRVSVDENAISLIDPACGSGTFLYSAVDRLVGAFGTETEAMAKRVESLVNNCVFGLDIAEFPLYLAEMNILMRMLTVILNEQYNNPVEKKIKVFKTRDSIAEFMDTALRNTVHEIDVASQKRAGQGFLHFEKSLDLGYVSYVRDEDDLKEMKESLENRPRCPRRRFDFVIGNPPYVGYNECAKQKVLIFELLKAREVRLNDIYGVNLHSTPDRTKKSPPKPNLYAFFIALGLALLKDNGRLCYIIPQTLLTAGDLDVLRFHLAKYTTIERLVTFEGRMFLGRGIRQNKAVATSSLILVVRRAIPDITHEVQIVNSEYVNTEIDAVIEKLRSDTKDMERKVPQKLLLENVRSWNFIKQPKSFLDFYEMYKKGTDGLSRYYEHSLAYNAFKTRFYFDIGYDIDERAIVEKREDGLEYYEYPKLREEYYGVRELRGYYPYIRSGTDGSSVKLLRNNQGYNLLESRYKIVWSYMNFGRFHFTDRRIVWARNQICGIGSENREELLYLFGVLNSQITREVLERNLRSENEKDLLVAIASVKEFVRVPQLSGLNAHIKAEVIAAVDEVLKCEEVRVCDCVDFSGVLMQRFEDVQVEGDVLTVTGGHREKKLRITQHSKLLENVIDEMRRAGGGAGQCATVTRSELMNMRVIDFQKRAALQAYIDDLIFAMCFDVQLNRVGLGLAETIKKACRAKRFYKTVYGG